MSLLWQGVPATAEPRRTPSARSRSARTRPSARPSQALPGRWRHALLLAAAIATAATVRAWANPTGSFAGTLGDPSVFAWYLAWVPHALTHGLNPLTTEVANLPHGANLMWNATMPLAGVVLAPVTLTAGPVAAYNLLITVMLGSNVAAGFALARRVAPTPAGAYLGAVLYATTPYIAGHALGHPNLLLIAYPALLTALLADQLAGRRTSRQVGLLIGLLTAAQAMVGLEMLALTALAGAIVLLWAAVGRRNQLAAAARPLLRSAGWAAGVAAPLLAWPAWVLLAGPQRITGLVHAAGYYDLDVANLAAATSVNVPSPFTVRGAEQFSFNQMETTGFLLPWLLAAVLTRRSWRGSPWAAPLLAVTAGSLLLALGYDLQMANDDYPVPGPWRILGRVPLVGAVLPVRLTLFTASALGLLVAISVPTGRPARRPSPRAVAAGAALLVAGYAALPAWPMPTSAVPSFPDGIVRAGDVVEFAPHPALDAPPMVWQAQDRFSWRMYDAYLITPQLQDVWGGRGGRVPCLTRSRAEACPASLAADLSARGVTVVVAGPGPMRDQMAARLTAALGPGRRTGSALWWRLAPPGR